MKIRPVGAELFHADGQTGRHKYRHDEANNRFLHFSNASKNQPVNFIGGKSSCFLRSITKRLNVI